MISIYIILGILFWHWFADFVMQTDKEATGKSKNMKDLLSHTVKYSVMWIIPAMIMLGFHGFTFAVITFICHTVTDYFTSRLNSKLWAEGKVHNFFVSIGFDQWLHYVQLFLTYLLLV